MSRARGTNGAAPGRAIAYSPKLAKPGLPLLAVAAAAVAVLRSLAESFDYDKLHKVQTKWSDRA